MRHGTWILIVGLLLAPLGYGIVDSEAAAIDQQQPIIDSSVGGLVIAGSSQQKLAQVVTAGVSGFLTGIRLPVSCGTGQLIVEIQGVDEDMPNGVVLTSESIPAASLTSIGAAFDPHYAFARLRSIPLRLTDNEVEIAPASRLRFRVLVRNACTGSGQPSGIIRLWYNGTGLPTGLGHGADSHVDVTIEGSTSSYFLRGGLALDPSTGTLREWAAVDVGEPCGPWVPFGTWSVSLP